MMKSRKGIKILSLVIVLVMVLTMAVWMMVNNPEGLGERLAHVVNNQILQGILFIGLCSIALIIAFGSEDDLSSYTMGALKKDKNYQFKLINRKK